MKIERASLYHQVFFGVQDKVISADEVLSRLTKNIKEINFKKIVNTNNDENFKLSQKHYLIETSKHLINLATSCKFNLAVSQGIIYIFNGVYWMQVETEVFKKFLCTISSKVGVKKYDANFFKFTDNLFNQFLHDAEMFKPIHDVNSVKINLLNGTYVITSKGNNLQSFNPKDYLNYQLPFVYDVNSKCPQFQKYLDRVLPDKSAQNVLAEYLGYVFIKHGSKQIKREKVLILYGGGQNGKSVFYEVMTALIGRENVVNYSLKKLTDEGGTSRANIQYKLLNYSTEISTDLNSTIFKQLASGEAVEVKVLYKNPFIMTDYAKMIFNCNQLPRDIELTDAFFRRFIIVPFSQTIPKEEQDAELHNKIIQNELSGVFNWVLSGLKRLLEQKDFSECDLIKKEIEKFKTESDTLQMFLNDNGCTNKGYDEYSVSELYLEFKTYCHDNGYKTPSNRTFRSRMESKGYNFKRNANGWFAIMTTSEAFKQIIFNRRGLPKNKLVL